MYEDWMQWIPFPLEDIEKNEGQNGILKRLLSIETIVMQEELIGFFTKRRFSVHFLQQRWLAL